MHILLCGIILTLTLAASTNGARILAVLPFAAKSHHIFFQAILKALALQGHQVVVYSPYPLDKPLPNYMHVYVNTSFSDDFITYETLVGLIDRSPVVAMMHMWTVMDHICEEAFLHENVQKLISSNEKFDLVITETFFGQEAFLGFGYKFNAPTITFQSFSSFGIINNVMGNSLALSYIPDNGLPFSNHMTLYERFINSYCILRNIFSFYYEHLPVQQAMMNQQLKLDSAPSLADMLQNISLVFTNAHPTIDYPKPLTPNIIPLGGIHVSSERKPLPQNIEKFMDDAKEGVIYFSLGSFVPDHRMPKEYFRNFVRVFQKLPQRVVWKTRAENILGLPENVLTSKWVPQQDILEHPNCVLFMTHGGLLSLLEAVHAGVPVVGTPFYGDQPMNVKFYQEKGIGVKLDFLTLSEKTISTAISTVLSNQTYKKNAQRLSQVFRDLPMSPADTAVYWVEYVLRHAGAHHLRPAATQLSWYQLSLLDILAAILIVLATIYFACRRIIAICLRSRQRKYELNKKIN